MDLLTWVSVLLGGAAAAAVLVLTGVVQAVRGRAQEWSSPAVWMFLASVVLGLGTLAWLAFGLHLGW